MASQSKSETANAIKLIKGLKSNMKKIDNKPVPRELESLKKGNGLLEEIIVPPLEKLKTR